MPKMQMMKKMMEHRPVAETQSKTCQTCVCVCVCVRERERERERETERDRERTQKFITQGLRFSAVA